jgi:hypothetical protein
MRGAADAKRPSARGLAAAADDGPLPLVVVADRTIGAGAKRASAFFGRRFLGEEEEAAAAPRDSPFARAMRSSAELSTARRRVAEVLAALILKINIKNRFTSEGAAGSWSSTEVCESTQTEAYHGLNATP